MMDQKPDNDRPDGSEAQDAAAEPSGGPLDLSRATPDLYAALVAAQAAAETVAKDGTNSQRGYRYATAEAMIRAVRGPLAANGLAFFSSWTREEVVQPGGPIGNQFVCAVVVIHWALVHRTGAVIRGACEMDAIGSAARPPDKAVAATLTYMRGFVLRDLLNMDRAQEERDAIDQRSDGDYAPRGGREEKTDGQQAKVDELRKRVSCLLGEFGDKAGVKPRDAVSRVLGKTVARSGDMTPTQLREVERAIGIDLARLEGGSDAVGDDADAKGVG